MNDEKIFSIIRLLLPLGTRAFVRLTRSDGSIREQDLFADTDAKIQNVIDREPKPEEG